MQAGAVGHTDDVPVVHDGATAPLTLDTDGDGIEHLIHEERGWFVRCCDSESLMQLDGLRARPGVPTCLDCARCEC